MIYNIIWEQNITNSGNYAVLAQMAFFKNNEVATTKQTRFATTIGLNYIKPPFN